MSTSPSTNLKMTPLLQANILSYSLGKAKRRVQVIRSLMLELFPKEKIAIIGPSGCGKSTLLALLGLLERPDIGEVCLNGKATSLASDETRARMRSEAIGFIFQFHFLLEGFTLLENLFLAMRRYRAVSTLAIHERASALLNEVGLGDKMDRYPSELSGGEQQRVAVARALVHDPKIILADEPTGNLDAVSADRVFELISYLAEKKGQAVVLVTHNLSIARRCDRVFMMKNGGLTPYNFPTSSLSDSPELVRHKDVFQTPSLLGI